MIWGVIRLTAVEILAPAAGRGLEQGVTAMAVMPRHSAEWIGVPVYREIVVPGTSPGTT